MAWHVDITGPTAFAGERRASAPAFALSDLVAWAVAVLGKAGHRQSHHLHRIDANRLLMAVLSLVVRASRARPRSLTAAFLRASRPSHTYPSQFAAVDQNQDVRSDLLGRHRDVVSALLALPDSPAFGVNASAGVAGIDQLEMGGASLSLPTDKVGGAVSTPRRPRWTATWCFSSSTRVRFSLISALAARDAR